MSNVKCSQVHGLTISSIPRGFAVSLLTLLIATCEIESNPPSVVKAILAAVAERSNSCSTSFTPSVSSNVDGCAGNCLAWLQLSSRVTRSHPGGNMTFTVNDADKTRGPRTPCSGLWGKVTPCSSVRAIWSIRSAICRPVLSKTASVTAWHRVDG
jgi:hypothetical protein